MLGAAAVVMYMMFGGGDGETTTDAVYTTTAPDTVAVTTAETEVIAEVTEDATPDVVALADGSKEYYTYGADGSVTAKRVEDAYGNVVARYEYADGVCVSEKNYASNGQLVYEVKIENGTKTVTEYYRTAEGAMAGGTKTVYSEDGNLIEIDTLNEYGNPVEIEFYENNELKFTRTYNIENGARVGYTDTYTDGKTVNYDMNGNEVKKPAETTATTKKPTATKPATTTAATTAATEPKPAATTYTESTGWSAAGSKIDKIYSTSTGALLKEITYQKINGQAYEKQVIDYTTSPRQKTVYERSTNGSITRTLYYQFNQNPGNYTKLIVKDANGSITKYEGYKRDDNGKIMITYIYDTAGTLQYYIKHESHGNYKYGADDSYLGKA